MATLLTIDMITREALRILHQKCNVIGNCNRQYDDSFATSGAKIGTTLRIRLPNQYTVRSGASLSAQVLTETNTTLALTNQKGVDLSFTSAELTLSLDDFSKRIIEPAMAVLAANIEADMLSNVYPQVYQQVGTPGSALSSFRTIMNARKKLNDSLAPMDNNRMVTLNTQGNVDLVDSLKGLFHSASAIEEQYTDGMMGKTAGFSFYENTLMPRHTVGNITPSTSTLIVKTTISAQGTTSVVIDNCTDGAGAFKKGDIVTFASVYRVHPETKVSTGELQQFVVTADATSASTDATIVVSPAMYTTGAAQNINAFPQANAVVVAAGTANTSHGINLAWHKDAFVFATADLVLPGGVDMASRQVFDGVSMRLVRQYSISDDTFPCRLDVLYGYNTIRPQLACRIAND